MDRKGPDLWIIEYGLFHDLDQVVAQIKEVNKVNHAQLEETNLFYRMMLNGLSNVLSNDKFDHWTNWLDVFVGCKPPQADPEASNVHQALIAEYKAQVQ